MGGNYIYLSLTLLWLAACFAEGLPGEDAPSSKFCSSENCHLPQCFCAGRRGPNNMQTHDIPQMVMLSFDDAINKQNIHLYHSILNGERRNPNGCPIMATFFVSHDWTDYKMVKDLYLAGHEIADHSVTHRLPRNWWGSASYRDWEEELEGQRRNIANKASVPRFEVLGVRVPFLEIGGNRQFELMSDKDFLYDSSFLSGPYNDRDWRLPAWPFTLDFAPELEYCDSSNCPKANFSGIWEVPLNRWLGLDGQACPMVDACNTQSLKNKNDVLRYLWKNFNRHYGKNRAPLGINIHAVWLDEEFKLEALQEFIDGILDLHDVYMINNKKVIEWMKQPTTLGAITKFEPWLNCENKKVLVQRRKATKKAQTKNQKAMPEEEEDPTAEPDFIRRKKTDSDQEAESNERTDEELKPQRRGNLKPKRRGILRKRVRATGNPVTPSTMKPEDSDASVTSRKVRDNQMQQDEGDDKNEVSELNIEGEIPKPKEKKRKMGKAGKAGTQTGMSKPEQSGSSVVRSTLVSITLSILSVKCLSS